MYMQLVAVHRVHVKYYLGPLHVYTVKHTPRVTIHGSSGTLRHIAPKRAASL